MSSTDSSTAPTMSMSAARAVFIKPQAFKESRAAAIAANLERKLKLPKNEEKSSVGDPSPPLHNPLPNVTSLKSKFERAPTRASAGSNISSSICSSSDIGSQTRRGESPPHKSLELFCCGCD